MRRQNVKSPLFGCFLLENVALSAPAMFLFHGEVKHETEVVPGVCRVEMLFVHLWFIPLFPTASYARSEKNQELCVKIPLRFKSVVAVWTLLAGVVCLLYGLFVALRPIAQLIALIDHPLWDKDRWEENPAFGAALILAAVSLFILARTRKASRRRAHELGRYFGLAPIQVDRVVTAKLGIEKAAKLGFAELPERDEQILELGSAECGECKGTGATFQFSVDSDGIPSTKEATCAACGGTGGFLERNRGH